jgi:hypothetical protein
LSTATYPSLTELSYVKGVTSAIQTQFSGKLSLTGGTLTGALSGTSATFSSTLGVTGAATFSSSVAINGANQTSELNIYAVSQPRITFQNSGANRAYISADGGNTIYNSLTGNGHQFQVDGSVKVAITGGGNVGIGTSSPTSIGGYTALTIDNASSGSFIDLNNSGTNNARWLSLPGGDVRFYSSSTLSLYTNGTSKLSISSVGVVSVASSGTGSIGLVNSSTSTTTVSIYSEMGVNTNNTSSFHFVGAQSGFGNRIQIFGNGNVQNSNNSYGAISDIKLKENIIDATDKLEKLLKVRIVNYNLIGDEQKQIGVIAQELEEIFPSMIDQTEDYEEIEIIDKEGNTTKEKKYLGTYTKSVKYSVFVPILIKAIQEQTQIIKDLEARIVSLESK